LRPLETNVDKQLVQAIFLQIRDLDAERVLEGTGITKEKQTGDGKIKNDEPEANAC
jgi:hypothetical protein